MKPWHLIYLFLAITGFWTLQIVTQSTDTTVKPITLHPNDTRSCLALTNVKFHKLRYHIACLWPLCTKRLLSPTSPKVQKHFNTTKPALERALKRRLLAPFQIHQLLKVFYVSRTRLFFSSLERYVYFFTLDLYPLCTVERTCHSGTEHPNCAVCKVKVDNDKLEVASLECRDWYTDEVIIEATTELEAMIE